MEGVTLQVSLPTSSFTRTQWYDMQCQFTRKDLRPAFVGHPVVPHLDSYFVDARKKVEGHEKWANSLYLSVKGYCCNLQCDLLKCTKCKELDRQLTFRKRKSEEMEWNEADQKNNEKLFQITGFGSVDKEGLFRCRFRVQCCFGSSRKSHDNHSSDNSVFPHKGCEGIYITMVISNDSTVICESQPFGPIKVISKFKGTSQKVVSGGFITHKHFISHTPNAKEKSPTFHNTTFEPDEATRHTSVPPSKDKVTLQTSSIYNEPPLLKVEVKQDKTQPPDSSPNIYPSPSPPEPSAAFTESLSSVRSSKVASVLFLPPVPEEYFGDLPDNLFLGDYSNILQLYTLMDSIRNFMEETSISLSLWKLTNLYKSKVDHKFPLACRAIFEQDFFLESNLNNLPIISPDVLNLCNTVYVALSMKLGNWSNNSDPLKISAFALKIAKQLLFASSRTMSTADILSLADGLTRSAVIQAAHGNLEDARLFTSKSYELYEKIAVFKPELRSMKHYQVMMWHKLSFCPEMTLAHTTYNWVRSINNSVVTDYVLFFLITSEYYPELYQVPSVVPTHPRILTKHQIDVIIPLCDELEQAFRRRIFIEKKDETCPKTLLLALSAVNALRHLVLGNHQESTKEIEECAVQSSITAHLMLEPIPIVIACFVAIQLFGFLLYPHGHRIELRPQEQDERRFLLKNKLKRRIINYVELFQKSLTLTLIRPWSLAMEMFNSFMFSRFCKELSMQQNNLDSF